jgi:hypothetical protein
MLTLDMHLRAANPGNDESLRGKRDERPGKGAMERPILDVLHDVSS